MVFVVIAFTCSPYPSQKPFGMAETELISFIGIASTHLREVVLTKGGNVQLSPSRVCKPNPKRHYN